MVQRIDLECGANMARNITNLLEFSNENRGLKRPWRPQ